MSYEYFAPTVSATYNQQSPEFVVATTQTLYVGPNIELVNLGGLTVEGDVDSEIDIDGTLASVATDGNVNVGETGSIYGHLFGLRADGSLTPSGVVTNYGHIFGASSGIRQIGYVFERIYNDGLIESGQMNEPDGSNSTNAAIYINAYGSPGIPTVLVNNGTIRADKLGSFSLKSVAAASADTVFNNGTMIGAVALGGGADKYDGHLGHHSELAADGTSTFSLIDGGDGNDTILGGSDADRVAGGNDQDSLQGNAGNDSLDGGAGNDTINGGTGSDSMTGGTGNDIFYVDSLGDKVIEAAGGGTDTILTSISLTLAANVERVATTSAVGTGALNFIGNELSNLITGNAGKNIILGGIGNDIIKGGAGVDTLDGGANSDTVDYSDKTLGITLTLTGATASTVKVGTANEDTIKNFENVIGGTGADHLTGDSGANSFRGGLGKDVMDGGGGIDTADYADKTQKVTVTLNGATAATVFINGTAAANAEDSIKNFENVTGGSAGDKLTGDALNNVLSGGAGSDTLSGGVGNDTLIGGTGADSMTGGAGADHFRFVWNVDQPAGADIITDFTPGSDRIDIDDATTAAHPLDAAQLAFAFNSGATNAHFVYLAGNGTLWYDPDGGALNNTQPLLMAVLNNHPASFSSADIWQV